MINTRKRLLIYPLMLTLVGVLISCANTNGSNSNTDSTPPALPDDETTETVKNPGTVTVRPTANGRLIADKVEGVEGDIINIEAIPDAGYKLKFIYVNNKKFDVNDDKYSFKLAKGNNIVDAYFELKDNKDVPNNIYISEFYNGSSPLDCAMEIASNKDNISLKGYKLNFYHHEKIKFTYTFDEQTLDNNETIVFYNKNFEAPDSISALNKIKLEDDYLVNRYYVEVVDSKNNLVDSIGYKISNEFVKNASLVRLPDYNKSHGNYRVLDYVKVNEDTPKYLGNTNSPLTLARLKEGPKIDEVRYGNLPFSDNGLTTGGYCEVRLPSNGLGDGDTTYFLFPEGSGIENSYDHRVRYMLIDTPEVSHGPNDPAEPYGNEAKKFNNDKLRKAKHIIVQSCLGSSLTGTYGRTLGFVWYTNEANPKISDYKLLNFEIVLAGLANVSVFDTYDDMKYQGVSYSTYINYAYQYAKELGIKIHSK